ncbi:hypothetical protein [Nitrososphaera sp.]|uniref:hypothetical protein n=1 Tax=Nitrososphaera sp. TaxID=1971748 RepID=UPI0018003B1A|nr:hypothetical protein [Nitrososphaera sp.]NWG38296.1 hypothetical protein [Nitrososphaera sp.]
MRGGKAWVAVAVSLLAASAFAVRPAYAAGPGDLATGFMGFFEYKLDVDSSELFPSEQVKDDLIAKSEPSQFAIAEIEREIAGFKVSAQDVLMKLSPSKLDQSTTRIDVDVQGRMVEINGIFTKTYSNVDVDGIYGVYNAATDKVTIHVPFAVALSLLFR